MCSPGGPGGGLSSNPPSGGLSPTPHPLRGLTPALCPSPGLTLVPWQRLQPPQSALALLRPEEARPAHGVLREGQHLLCRLWYPGPHLAQGSGPSPQLSCEQDPSPQLCLWKESWFPRKLPGNKRHAYIFQNKLIKGLGALLFYFWQRCQSRNRGPALCDLMFAELGAVAAGPRLPSRLARPVRSSRYPARVAPASPKLPSSGTSQTHVPQFQLQVASERVSRTFPLLPRFIQVGNASRWSLHFLLGQGRASPAASPLPGHIHPQSRAGLLHAPRATFLLHMTLGLSQGTSDSPTKILACQGPRRGVSTCGCPLHMVGSIHIAFTGQPGSQPQLGGPVLRPLERRTLLWASTAKPALPSRPGLGKTGGWPQGGPGRQELQGSGGQKGLRSQSPAGRSQVPCSLPAPGVSPCLSASIPRWGKQAGPHPGWLQALRDGGCRTPANSQFHVGFLIHQRLRRRGPSQAVPVESFLLFSCLCCVFYQALAQVEKKY